MGSSLLCTELVFWGYNMKLQIYYELYITFFIFIGIVFYVINYLFSYRSVYLKEIKKEILLQEAYRLSQFLTNDIGEPSNWYNNIASIKRIGLLSSPSLFNHLSLSKISSFNVLCQNNYTFVKQALGLEADFNILLTTNEGTILINCERPLGEEVVEISRIVSLDENKMLGVLRIWVY